MDRKLTDKEKAVIKMFADIMAEHVMGNMGNNKATINNDPRTRERVKAIASDLQAAFWWRATKDGEEYWCDVQKRLNRIAEEGY